ncbi:MAG: tetratricopeptide repeat protein [Proteobacteria bacterium]|nr:tetratricopeptide repeat protein [Pseudomonadota bacterium]
MNNFFAELKRRNVVRVAVAYVVVAWVILQFIDVIQDPLNLPGWFQTVTIVFLGIGFPIALLMSWAYEVTTEGVKKTEEVDKSKSITHGTGQRINKLIVGALVLAIGFIVYDKLITPDDPAVQQAQAERVTIAVLPFSDLSPEGDQEYFGDGIAEEILNVLVKADGLKVTSRSSSFSFKGQNLDIPTMAERLGVDNILEGSVRKSGNRVRITAQLVDVASDTHLWSETFDRDISDVFQVQDEIARAIGRALEIQFGVGQGTQVVVAQTLIPEAHEEYLKGRYLWNKRTIANLYNAIVHFERATQLDPEYAMAHLGLAEARVLIPDYDPVMRDQREVLEMAEKSARRALELNSALGQAHTTLGFVLSLFDRWGEADQEFKKSLELAPDYATGWQWYGTFKTFQGNLDEAEELLFRARELDPLSPIILTNYIDLLFFNGKIELASQELERALSLFPNFPLLHSTKGNIHLRRGEFEEARRAKRRMADLFGLDPEIIVGWVDLIEEFQKTGVAGRVPEKLEESIAQNDIFNSPIGLVFMAGHPELALEAMDEVFGMTGPRYYLLYYFWGPAIDPYRNLPRFKQILTDRGFVDLWKKYGWPDMCRPIGEEDFICE